MRSVSHWTPRYIKDRLAEMYYHRSFPDHPWLTQASNQILGSYLWRDDIGLEFGSGRSTIWLAKHVQHLTSAEHDETWYTEVSRRLAEKGLNNVDYHFLSHDKKEEEGADASYVRLLDSFETESLDFVLVDGIYRDYSALGAIRVIRPGGLLIIDNVNWFLPCRSYSPSSRTAQQGPKGEIWKEVHRAISQWRRIWTSSGITDTGLFLSPASGEVSPP